MATSNVTVNLSLNTSGTCTANGSDYSVSSPITINSGQSQATSNVTIYGDTTAEDNETVCIDISSVTNGIEDGTQQARLTILNDDAAGPVLDNATPSEQQNTVYWQAYSNASSYTLYWKTSSGVSTSDDNITISDNSSTSYIHGGLDNGTTYYYKLVANTASGSSGSCQTKSVASRPPLTTALLQEFWLTMIPTCSSTIRSMGISMMRKIQRRRTLQPD